ncbi:hypothetical protein QL285_082249 [Trifolium repens]|nr:hypothetical protein QL285_082249 [Trifolium repens]
MPPRQVPPKPLHSEQVVFSIEEFSALPISISPQLNEYAETACSPTSLIPNTTYIKQSQPPVGDYTPHSLDTCQTIPSTSLGLLYPNPQFPRIGFLCVHITSKRHLDKSRVP